MLTEERKKRIIDLIDQEEIIKSQALMKDLNASESTIRRDLQELEAAGLLKRVHGGAKKIVKLDHEPTMLEKSSQNVQNKQLIAKYACQLINDGDVIYLDAGTSTYEMIPFLANKDITVVTNSVYHAAALSDLNISTMIIGGNIKLNTKAVVSAFSVKQITLFRFDKSFMGINGVHSDYGLTTPDSEEATMKTSAINQSEQIFFMADSSKFNKVSFAKVADIDTGIIITDRLAENVAPLMVQLSNIKEVN